MWSMSTISAASSCCCSTEAPRNDIVNLGTMNVSTDAYFGAVGAITGHRPLFVPNWLMALVGKALPSTLWFFARNVAIDSDKVAALTGFPRTARWPIISRGVRCALRPIRSRRCARISNRRGRSGRMVGAIICGSTRRMRTTAWRWRTIPASRNSTAIGCASRRGHGSTRSATISTASDCSCRRCRSFSASRRAPASSSTSHGSSREHFSLYEFIDEIRYLDEAGDEVVSQRDEALWADLRRREAAVHPHRADLPLRAGGMAEQPHGVGRRAGARSLSGWRVSRSSRNDHPVVSALPPAAGL